MVLGITIGPLNVEFLIQVIICCKGFTKEVETLREMPRATIVTSNDMHIRTLFINETKDLEKVP